MRAFILSLVHDRVVTDVAVNSFVLRIYVRKRTVLSSFTMPLSPVCSVAMDVVVVVRNAWAVKI